MDYSTKLKTKRFRKSSVLGRSFDDEMESDRGRALNSAAVRRLQQKTQVFPLETNAAVRSRLTHSLEVQQVGRYISKLILNKLSIQDNYNNLNIDDKKDGFISAVEIACLLHDIGNPPFGHFGEKAIGLWVKKFVAPIFNKAFTSTSDIERLIRDLETFEGNAQGIRILHSLQGLNLSYTQLACLIKYTRPSHENKPAKGDEFSYRKKKCGFYYSEEELIKDICHELGISTGCRFPLTYIMEAADDISYCIADLDDAIDKGILSVNELHNAILKSWSQFHQENSIIIEQGYLTNLANTAYAKFISATSNKNHTYILTLRTNLVNDLATYAAKRFTDNHLEIFNGTFDQSLLDGDDKFHYATETLRNVAINHVFNTKEVENLELKGYSVISGLLNIYTPLIEMPFDDFRTLQEKNNLKEHPIETRLFHNLSEKHKSTYISSVTKIFKSIEHTEHEKALELYYRTRLVIDYISGMTDNFALNEFQNLSAAI